MEIEFGASQYEFTFDPADPMAHADGMILFRSMVKQVALRMGLHATFMCRPRVEHGIASGWHMHQSIVDGNGRNVFVPADDGTPSAEASAWIAGLLEHAAATCVLTTPTVNGYKRFQPNVMAPDRIQWGYDNKGAMVRALMAPGDDASRIENRVAEPAANPHYTFASQIACGLDGLSRGLRAPPPVETPYASGATRLPSNLGAAVDAFAASTFHREAMGEVFVDYVTFIKRKEWERYLATISEWEQREYFTLF
jgi:glutamine synthetase